MLMGKTGTLMFARIEQVAPLIEKRISNGT
jgi:hypothetical protein